ncbi:MAG TPA: type II toxin-antitoxin system HicB family antitoxin, partial [Rhizomicrobium sp.]
LTALQRDKSFQRDAKGAVVVAVDVDLPGKSVRVNISLEEHLLEAIDRAAGSAGQSRSAFLADAAQRRIKSAA